MERKELDKLEAEVQSGDTIVVTKLDRVARSLVGGYELIDSWIEKESGERVESWCDG